MVRKQLIIIFRHDKAYLTENIPMTFEQVGLSAGIASQKEFKSPAYWMLSVIKYNKAVKKLICRVVSYNIGETEFEESQIVLSEELTNIETVIFRNLDTFGLLSTFNGSWIRFLYSCHKFPVQTGRYLIMTTVIGNHIKELLQNHLQSP